MPQSEPGFGEWAKSESVRLILTRYEMRGGDSADLSMLLHYLLPKQERPRRIPHRSRMKRLKRCASAIKDVLAIEDLHSRPRRSFSQALRDVEFLLASSLTEEERDKVWKDSGLSRPGRRTGPTLESLIPAILALEFRRRFGLPFYKDILTLLQAVAPAKFPPTTTQEHIRQRILSTPSEIAQDHHDSFFR